MCSGETIRTVFAYDASIRHTYMKGVYVCVCVRERERERVCVCVCVRARARTLHIIHNTHLAPPAAAAPRNQRPFPRVPAGPLR